MYSSGWIALSKLLSFSGVVSRICMYTYLLRSLPVTDFSKRFSATNAEKFHHVDLFVMFRQYLEIVWDKTFLTILPTVNVEPAGGEALCNLLRRFTFTFAATDSNWL